MKCKTLIFSLIFLLGTIVLSSCKSGKEATPTGTAIKFSEIKTGTNSSYSEFTTFEIHNFQELAEVWSNFFTKYDRKPPIPKIDFENKMLIAAALGERNSGGYSIKIKSVLETNQTMIVVTEETKPGNTCNSATVMVYPFQLVEISKTGKPITFTKTVKVNECEKGF